jgi:hypothetical protein
VTVNVFFADGMADFAPCLAQCWSMMLALHDANIALKFSANHKNKKIVDK